MTTITAKEIEFQMPSGKIAGVAWGNPSLPPILATHGWLDNAASFNHLLPLMKNFYILAIDLPGHGFSSHRPHGCYFHFIDYIPDIIMLLDELHWEKCSLLGHSLGAGIFSIVAGVIPERIDKLMLIDALAPFSEPADEMPKRIRSATKQYQRLDHKTPPLYESFEEAVQARLRVSEMKESSVRTIVQRGIKQNGEYFVWRNDPKLLVRSMFMFTEEQVQAYLSKITANTCLIRPTHGWPVNETLFQQRIQHVENIEVHHLPGHHHLHLDNPKPVADLLNSFLGTNQ